MESHSPGMAAAWAALWVLAGPVTKFGLEGGGLRLVAECGAVVGWACGWVVW